MSGPSEASVRNSLIATGSNKAEKMGVCFLCLYVLCWLQTLRWNDHLFRRFLTGVCVSVCLCVCVCVCVCLDVSDPKNLKIK